MDHLSIQRSLALLEERFREVRKTGQEQLENCEKVKAAMEQRLADQAEILKQAQEDREDKTTRIRALEAQLATLTAERDTAVKDKAAAEQSATELKQQLTAQAETLQQTQKARDEQAARVQTLEGELASLKAQQSGVAARLQRLRHLAHPAGRAT